MVSVTVAIALMAVQRDADDRTREATERRERQIRENGLAEGQVEMPDETLLAIIRGYTREAGVRNLEREIGSCCRKVARKFVAETVSADFKHEIGPDQVRDMLGPIKFRQQGVAAESEIGLATGLAWTEVGGEVLILDRDQEAAAKHAAEVGGSHRVVDLADAEAVAGLDLVGDADAPCGAHALEGAIFLVSLAIVWLGVGLAH